MKTIKILLGIIAINLTLLTIIQTGVWPPKVQASETNHTNVNYGLVPLNEDGSIDVNINSSAAIMDVNLQKINGYDNYGWENLSPIAVKDKSYFKR